MSDDWMKKWQFIIDRIGKLIAREGKKIAIINVQAQRNVKEQFKQFQETCEVVKHHFEMVVTTSLPEEERIFWVHQDVQFYIPDDKGPIRSTGNSANIQKILNFKDEPINADIPSIEYWKDNDLVLYLDNFPYVEDRTQLEEFSYNSKELVEKYKTHQARLFENSERWYFMKLLFIGSELSNLEGFGDLIGGVPNGLMIKCSCGQVLEHQYVLKGMLRLPEYNFTHQYYLWLSKQCSSCGRTVGIYRDKALDKQYYFTPIRPFFNFVDSSWNYSLEEEELVGAWQMIVKQVWDRDADKIAELYSSELTKFGDYIQKMAEKYS